jgi:hypothetical protein
MRWRDFVGVLSVCSFAACGTSDGSTVNSGQVATSPPATTVVGTTAPPAGRESTTPATAVTDTTVPPVVPESTNPAITVADTTAPPVVPESTNPATTGSTGAPLPAVGDPSPGCVNGWMTPDPGTPLRTAPLDLMRADMGLQPGDLFLVDEMRYCVGPENTNIVAPRRDVERWYVRGSLVDDPGFAGRWLVRRTGPHQGVEAVAPYESTGFETGTWVSFIGGESEDDRRVYPGLPGTWIGVPEELFAPPCTATYGPYCRCDWGVSGCTCYDASTVACTGPPPEVMGCFEGL